MTAHTWMDAAACGTMPGFLNLPTARQKAICADCPVRESCADFAPTELGDATLVDKGWPVYGGLSGREQVARLGLGLCPQGHDRAMEGRDATGWCKGCRRELNARNRARQRAAKRAAA